MQTNGLYQIQLSTMQYGQNAVATSVGNVLDEDVGQPYTVEKYRRTIAERIKLKIDEFALQDTGDGFRTHLGWSVIGHECLRYLYYHWRWFKKEIHTARMERIFIEGHKIEAEIRFILKSLGATFLDTVDADGKQIKVSDLGGHFGGSCDGVFIWPEIGLTIPTLLECKSSKTGSPFNALEKEGVEQANPRHFIQQSGYGAKLNIGFACYVVRNKNDSSIYVEIVELDFNEAEKMRQKAQHIMSLQILPKKISEKRNFHVCNMCTMQELCHDRKPPVPNCRNCVNSVPLEGGAWGCNLYQSTIPEEYIIQGCNQHQFLPW